MTSRFYSKRSFRTCICCRSKMLQRDLIRFSHQTSRLELYSGVGRSFYICYECCNNTDKAFKSIKRIVKNDVKREFEEIMQICKNSL